MINVPILGSFIPIVLPALVVIFCLLFAILSVFKLKNKALQAFKNVSEEDKKDDDKTGDKSLIENIVKGERAVLIEVDLSKKR